MRSFNWFEINVLEGLRVNFIPEETSNMNYKPGEHGIKGN
jgi:hypothetical protein